MNLFYDDFKIDKPLRLIELFAGYGSQAMAFKRLNIPFEHHFVCEFDKYAIKSYNAVHGTNYNPIDIKNVHGEDLNIKDTDKYCYFMTYSFPCTDISVAGKMASVKDGLKKGSDTRSGLLWEVERLLEECTELPQILFMENVPGVASLEGFTDWRIYLEKKGYSNYWKILNAKDFGVPQNRERCFMFSFLGDYDYQFPEVFKLEKRLKDILEDEVDEKYYLKNEKAKKLIEDLIVRNIIPSEQNRTEQNRTEQNRTEQKELIYQHNQVELKKSQTALQSDMMLESANIRMKEQVLFSALIYALGGKLKDVSSCIKARYDAGITNHLDDNTGVLEIENRIKSK